jgi:hypothetical protein
MQKNDVYSLYFNHAAKRDNRRHTMITSVFWKRWSTVFGRPQQSQRRVPGATNKFILLVRLPSLMDARTAFAKAKGDNASDWFAYDHDEEAKDRPVGAGSSDRSAVAAVAIPAVAVAAVVLPTTQTVKVNAPASSSSLPAAAAAAAGSPDRMIDLTDSKRSAASAAAAASSMVMLNTSYIVPKWQCSDCSSLTPVTSITCSQCGLAL